MAEKILYRFTGPEILQILLEIKGWSKHIDVGTVGDLLEEKIEDTYTQARYAVVWLIGVELSEKVTFGLDTVQEIVVFADLEEGSLRWEYSFFQQPQSKN